MKRKLTANGHFGAGISYSREPYRDTRPDEIKRLEHKRREIRAKIWHLSAVRDTCRNTDRRQSLRVKIAGLETKMFKLDQQLKRKGA